MTGGEQAWREAEGVDPQHQHRHWVRPPRAPAVILGIWDPVRNVRKIPGKLLAGNSSFAQLEGWFKGLLASAIIPFPQPASSTRHNFNYFDDEGIAEIGGVGVIGRCSTPSAVRQAELTVLFFKKKVKLKVRVAPQTCGEKVVQVCCIC